MEVHRLAKVAECARIVRTVAGRTNVAFPAVIAHQFQNRGSRQELLRENVRENKVVPGVRSVHQEGASRGQDAGHLLKRCEWFRQMLDLHVAGDQIEAGVGEGERVQSCTDEPGDIGVLTQVRKIKIDANDETGQTDQLVFDRVEVLTEQMPAATRVQPADGTSQILPDRLTPDLLAPPEMS